MGDVKNSYTILIGNPEGKGQRGRSRRRWEDNINFGEGKSKVVPMFNSSSCHEHIWGSVGIAPCILKLETRQR
jgi:hypothetical protein